jgi:HAMP domain-containing protein
VEISAELKQDIQRSRAWQHHNRMMKDRNGMPPPQDMRLYGSIELPNGGWLQFSSLVDKETASWSWQTTLNLLLVASLVIGLMIWLFRRATRPLKQLAANADRLGRGEDIEPLREEGPTEIRESIQAFNRMHTRLIASCRTEPGCWPPSPTTCVPHHQPAATQRVSGGRGGQGALPADPAADGADAGGDPELCPGGGAAGGDPGAGSGQPAGEPV